jgi:two-component system NtrC family sensor kinase
METGNIELRMELAPGLPLTLADEDQMQQVFVNVIKNAVEAMADECHCGVLRVKTRVMDGFVRVTVADDGPGILDADIRNVFDPFFTTKDVGKGTGLGLSICYGIVENHGGRIRVASKPGEGALFTVEIPIVSEHSPDGEPPGISATETEGPPR